MSTWLITGGSSGLGRDLARAVLEPGHNAVLTARNPASVRDLAGAHPDTALPTTVIADYAETAGKRRKEVDTADGNQPGDPARAAQAIIAAVEADEPPALLMLGPDALSAIRSVIDAQLAELKDWEDTSLGTDLRNS